MSYGLARSGVQIEAGFDIDEQCEFAYEANIDAPFFRRDIRKITGSEIQQLYPKNAIRLLAGCAPCQPFSRHMRGADTTKDSKWTLLDEFGRLAKKVRPELITMENVTGLGSTVVFERFVEGLESIGYYVTWKSCHGPSYGLAQKRRRLVLLASSLGPITSPLETHSPSNFPTVRDVIGDLPRVGAGEIDPHDRLHMAMSVSALNRKRLMASVPGGTWRDWPEELLADCHKRSTGASFQSVYGRMKWDQPSPTITTQAYNFGTGRFGHPEQCRAITIREAAMLQGFPKGYKFVDTKEKAQFSQLGRLIGNAVPPPLGKAIGKQFIRHISEQ